MISIKDNTIIKFIWAALIFSGLGIIVTLSVYIAYGHITLFNDFNDQKIESLGSFVGGFFGTFLTIAATFLIWLTYNSQKKELEKTTQIAEIQSKTLITQQFESTFFNMTKTLSEIPLGLMGVLPVSVSSSDQEVKGRTFLSEANKCIIRKFDPDFKWEEVTIPVLFQNTEKIYNQFYDDYLGPLDHYFRYFYNIVKFIDKSNIPNKKMYADLLQAQLSKEELGLLFYNGIGRIGKKHLYGLLEKYNILENINPKSIFLKEMVQTKLYPYTTFKFLSENIKGQIILKAILYNPDKVNEEMKVHYYIDKYNIDRDSVLALEFNLKDKKLDLLIDVEYFKIKEIIELLIRFT